MKILKRGILKIRYRLWNGGSGKYDLIMNEAFGYFEPAEFRKIADVIIFAENADEIFWRIKRHCLARIKKLENTVYLDRHEKAVLKRLRKYLEILAGRPYYRYNTFEKEAEEYECRRNQRRIEEHRKLACSNENG